MKPKAWSRWKNQSANSAYGEKENGKGGDNSTYGEKHNRKRSANPGVRDKQIWKVARKFHTQLLQMMRSFSTRAWCFAL